MPTPHIRRPSGISRRRLGALLAIPALVAPMLITTGASPASAEPVGTGPVAAPELASDGAEPVAVTLITGDTVLWTDTGDGSPRVEIEEAPRDHPVYFDQSGTQQDFYIIPSDAMPHVVAGAMDEELFNVPGLIRQGLDDKSTSGELPVIVTFDQDRTSQQLARDANALPAAGRAIAIERVNGAGITIDRGNAAKFRNTVLGRPARGKGRDSSTSAQSLDGEVEQIRLDRVLEVDLDESVPQIGAPQAWDVGYTGEGVTVAVLDTGVDTNHPDLAGQVVAEANFTDEPDATDHHGHGTHVASTIAGTGAASGGQYTGVAPGAELVSGKVCNRDGDCLTSWIMAGMEWATAQQEADVVNMSLGGDPTDGTDPLSQHVDQISTDTGALFVIAAGNSGCRLGAVGSPGTATTALTVGAVDKSNQMAGFSSCGPRAGDHAVKPEITAPGVGIVAARAAGTELGNPVDDHYTSLNGTSMATPHVAGSAALLAQARPDLGRSELKDALVSTAADGGFHWYQQGAGRVDVPASVDSPVSATGSLNFIEGQAQQDITYTNRSGNDLILSLDVAAIDRGGQAIGALALSTNTVAVPANSRASVTVNLDRAETSGRHPYGGLVTATGPNVALRTVVGFGPALQRVTIEVLDFDGHRIGNPTVPDSIVSLIHDTFDPEIGGTTDYSLGTSEGIATGYVPAGIYTIVVNVFEADPDTRRILRSGGLVKAEVRIDSATTLILDARDALPVQVTVPRKVDKRGHEVQIIRQTPAAAGGRTFAFDLGGFGFPVYVTPTPPGELAFLALWVRWYLAEPQPLNPVFGSSQCPRDPRSCYSPAPAYIYNLPFMYENGIPQDLREMVTGRDLVTVPTRYHSDKADVLIQRDFWALAPLGRGVQPRTQRMWIQPGQVTEYFLADDRMTWERFVSRQYRADGVPPTLSFTQWSGDRFTAAEAGTKRNEERWFEGPVRVGIADVREEYLNNPAGHVKYAAASRGGPNGSHFRPGFYARDNSRGHLVDGWTLASWRMWNLDAGTELLAIEPLPPGSLSEVPVFSLEADEATYRLEQIEDYPTEEVGDLFRTGPVTTTWTFTSRPSDAGVPAGYECPIQSIERPDTCQIQPLIQLDYDLGLDINNQIPAGRMHRFTIVAGHHSKAIDRAEVTRLLVQASFDDGDTWTNARVIGKPKGNWGTGGPISSAQPGSEFKIALFIPPLYRTIGSVTLRVQAEDVNGGTVEQTIRDAYLLK